jgi:hypothetical protein
MGGGRSYLASDRVTPKYDIHIGQHGKPRLDILKLAPSGPSGHHPGFESGFQGGISKAIPSPTLEGAEEVTIEGGNLGLSADQNKIPTIMARQASQTQTPQYDYTMDASAGSPAKKKGSMIKDIADALKDLDPGPDATPLTGGKFGRGMPAPLGFSLANMGAYVSDPVATQTAMAKARMEEELQRRRKLLGGGY